MIRVGLIKDQTVPASVRFYRTAGTFPFLTQNTGGQIIFEDIDQEQALRHETNIFKYNAVIIERPITQNAYQLIQLARAQGVLTWIDYDDDLLNVPEYNKASDFYAVDQNMQLVQACMSSADIVSVATDGLKELYSGYNRNVVTINNAWNNYRYPLTKYPEEQRKPVRIAWRGSDTHFGDLYGMKSVMAKLVQDQSIKMTWYGWRPPFLPIKRRDYKPWTGLFSYLQTFWNDKPDFLVVSLTDNTFNKGKSNCSWIEATVGGTAVIAPMGLPEFNRPGVIRYKDAKHLQTIIDKVKAGKISKAERINASREELQSNYALSEVNRKRAEILFKAFGYEMKDAPDKAEVE